MDTVKKDPKETATIPVIFNASGEEKAEVFNEFI